MDENKPVVTEAPKEEVKEKPAKAVAKKEVAYYEAVGRRKVSTARVRLYVVTGDKVTINGTDVAKGEMVVNGRPIDNYFPGEVYKKMYQEPFRTTNTMNRFVVSIKTVGGGLAGQLGAVIHSVSRALLKVDNDKFRPILKKRGFLTRDPRAKERRKAGLAGKARAKRQSPKR